MEAQARPFRSVLYIPGSNARALEKARSLAADAIIYDLEDAVTPDAKPEARATVARILADDDFTPQARIVRINAMDTEWGADDARALVGLGVEAVLIPKVNTPDDVQAVARALPGKPLWAMMETPMAMLNAAAIAGHPALTGMVMGTNDLATDLGAKPRADRLPLQAGLGLSLLAARAHGLVIIDGVYNAFKDEAGLRAECEQGRDMGFDGKTLIHPAQIGVTNQIFAPSAEDIDLARAQIAAFEEVASQGQGVAVLNGRIVENLHVASAQRLLARAAAIAER